MFPGSLRVLCNINNKNDIKLCNVKFTDYNMSESL